MIFSLTKYNCVGNQILTLFIFAQLILHSVPSRRQHILEQCLEIIFTQYAALFGILEDILEILELISEGYYLFVGLIEFGESLGDFFDELRGLG
jgi:hypothetical protein